MNVSPTLRGTGAGGFSSGSSIWSTPAAVLTQHDGVPLALKIKKRRPPAPRRRGGMIICMERRGSGERWLEMEGSRRGAKLSREEVLE